MPYIKADDRAKVKKNVLTVATPGELNYLITLTLLNEFRLTPKYDMIHELKKDFVIAPKHNKFLRSLVSSLAGSFTTDDVYTAAALAYDEFSRRIVAAYETKKANLNGEVEEYTSLLAQIEELK